MKEIVQDVMHIISYNRYSINFKVLITTMFMLILLSNKVITYIVLLTPT
jgi:hypothetical protein